MTAQALAQHQTSNRSLYPSKPVFEAALNVVRRAPVPQIPDVVMALRRELTRPEPDLKTASDLVALDPVLTGQVLKLVNSAYYSLPNQVTSLTRAIIMLGLNTVKNLALSAAILQSVGSKASFQAFSMEDFWAHSITVGVTAKRLASEKRIPISEREEYFVAGLLHDIGKIPLNNRFPEEYTEALQLSKKDQVTLYKTESAVLGINHCIVGRMIAEKWKLNDRMTGSLLHHHHPEQAVGDSRPLIFTVALADTYSNMLEKGVEDAQFRDNPLMVSLVEATGIQWDTLYDLRQTVYDEVEKAKIFLQVTTKG